MIVPRVVVSGAVAFVVDMFVVSVSTANALAVDALIVIFVVNLDIFYILNVVAEMNLRASILNDALTCFSTSLQRCF